MRYLVLFLSISILLLEGCNENVISSNNEKNIYPLKVGNQWIYSQWLFGLGDTITIKSTSSFNGKVGYNFSGVWDYSFERFSLYYENSKLYGFNPWDSAATELFDENILETLPAETISIPTGTFSTYKYTWGNKHIYTYWISRGFGVVKVMRDGFVTELINVTLH
jgi:hypothetical protein